MRGEYNGLQAKIKSENNQAIYIWCWAHRLNLIVEQGVKSCLEAVNFFGILAKVYDFICSSKNRVFVFEQNQKERNPTWPVRSLKRVTTTRWSSHSTALNTILITWEALIDTLEELHKSESSSDASKFIDYFQTERFSYTCFVFKRIFGLLDPLSKVLQAIDTDLIIASEMIISKKNQLLKLRDEFDSIIFEVNKFIEVHSEENFTFTPLSQKRHRKRKRMPCEQASDEPTTDPLNNFKYHTFYIVIDIISNEIDKKFGESSLSVFKDLSLITKKRILEIKTDNHKMPNDAFESISLIYPNFLNAELLKTEFMWLVNCFSDLEKTYHLPESLHKTYLISDDGDNNDVKSNSGDEEESIILPRNSMNISSLLYIFQLFTDSSIKYVLPNIYMLIKIGVTLPVSSASTERSFSKLKLIKTRLRLTMAKPRLEGLMRIACEQDHIYHISQISIDKENVINTFANNRNFLFIYGHKDTSHIYIRSPYYTTGVFDNNGCSLSFQMHTNVSVPSQVSIMLKTENYTSLIQDNVENNSPVYWEKKKILLGRQTRQVIIELNIKLGSHVAIDDIRLEDCLPEYFAGITDNGCPTDSHFLCSDNMTCIPYHHVCDISPDCPDETDETENCFLVPTEARCTFESGFCGWRNTSGEMSLTWKLYKGDRHKFTGPKWDNTFRNRTGTYAYVDMSGSSYLGATARMDSIHFHPPPTYCSDTESKYYNSCYISFFYHKYGSHSGTLGLYLVEAHGEVDRVRRLWWSFGTYGNTWLRTVVYLVNITTSYYLQFEARKLLSVKGDVAIDDIAMSPKCFGLDVPEDVLKGYKYEAAGIINNTATLMKIPINPDFRNKIVYKFTTCGSKGRLGPSNRSCEAAYTNTTVSVIVVNDTYMDGVQIWHIPETGVYTIIARGARGGKGADGMGISKGATAIAVVELTKHQQLHILVGQEGGDACRKTFEKRDDACQQEQYFRTGSALKELHDLRLLNGGGGGGGGSFVFTGSREEGFLPLVIGAGGGGLAHGPFKDDRSQHGNGTNMRLPAITAPSFGENPAGAGGGWAPGNYTEDKKSTGSALLGTGGVGSDGGGVGGLACYKSRGNTKGFGGFGGGGGGCVAGGGGGGFTGGRAWSNSQTNGEGGWSYLPDNQHVFYRAVYPGSNYKSGSVYIIPAIVGCGCAYLCVATNQLRSSVVCICPADFKLGPDGKSCIYQSTETTKIIFLITGSVFAVVIICLILGIWMYRSYRKRKERKENINIIHNGILNYDPISRNRNGNVDINPTYDFNGRILTTNDLPRILRDELRIQKSIGEGAFGVVYRGYYKKTGETEEMRVAIKTLQPKKDMTNVEVKFDDDNTPSTEVERETRQRLKRAELSCIRDFLTEAIIMSQFNHPNIVKFIGITFEKNYRFIVTELLSGGDLKEFLRKNRPSAQQNHKIIPVKLKDLIKIALDISKGCVYLENLHFIHRDIAARNCLLSTTGRGRVTKIADFGMSRDVYRNEYYRKDGQAMLPIKWMPTESLVDGVFNSKSDVWSYGITFWEIMTFGSMPYTGMTNKETMNYVMRGGRLSRPVICPEPVYTLMSSCWITNPEERPTFECIRNKLRLFIQDPDILNYTPPVIGRPAAPLPYRATHPLDENAPPDGVLRAVDVVNSSGAINEPQPYKSQEEPQYVTPLPADEFFEGVDAELMKDEERFGRFRRSNEMAPLDDMRDYCDDDDDDDDDSVGDEEDEDEDAINVAEAEDEAEDDDDDDNDEQNVEEEEDEDVNGVEIELDADNNRFDEDDDDAYGDNARSNGPVSSYHWNRFKETSFISMKEPNTKQTDADGKISSSKRRKSFSELEDNRPNPYSLTGRVRYNVASDGKIRC